MAAYALNVASDVVDHEPSSYTEVMESVDSGKWQVGMEEEIKSLHKIKHEIL